MNRVVRNNLRVRLGAIVSVHSGADLTEICQASTHTRSTTHVAPNQDSAGGSLEIYCGHL